MIKKARYHNKGCIDEVEFTISSIVFSIVVTMKARDKYDVFIDEGEFTIC